MSEQVNKNRYHVRWMVKNDLHDVMPWEDGLSRPWSEVDYRTAMAKRNAVSMLAEQDAVVRGIVVYELQKYFLDLRRIVVAPEHRLRGCGRSMIEMMVGKLSMNRRRRIRAIVSDDYIGAMRPFLRSCGFVFDRSLEESTVWGFNFIPEAGKWK